MMENLRNFPTEVAGRAIRLHRWRLGCFNTKKLEIFLSLLVVFSFFFRAGHNRRRTEMRDENHHGQQGPPLVTVHWQRVSSERLLLSLQTCFFTFHFLEINNWPTLLFIFIIIYYFHFSMIENRCIILLYGVYVHMCTVKTTHIVFATFVSLPYICPYTWMYCILSPMCLIVSLCCFSYSTFTI